MTLQATCFEQPTHGDETEGVLIIDVNPFGTNGAKDRRLLISKDAEPIRDLVTVLDEIRRKGIFYEFCEMIDEVNMMAIGLETRIGQFSMSMIIPQGQYDKKHDFCLEKLAEFRTKPVHRNAYYTLKMGVKMSRREEKGYMILKGNSGPLTQVSGGDGSRGFEKNGIRSSTR